MASYDATFGGHPFALRLNVVVASQNYASNYSTTNWSMQVIKTGNFTPYRTDAAATWGFNYVGSGNWGPYNFNGAVGQTITIASGSFNVGHNTDGTQTMSLSWSADAKSTITTAAGGASFALPTIPRAPGAPTIGAFSQSGPTSATLNWTAPANNGGSAITGYRIQYGTDSGYATSKTVDPGNVTGFNLTSLTPGSQVYARVQAQNAATAAGVAAPYSGSASVIVVAEIGDLDGWTAYGTLPSGLTPLIGTGIRRGSIYPLGAGAPTGLLREIQSTSTGSAISAGTLGLRRIMTDLTIGSTYKLNGTALSLQDTTPPGNTYAFGVIGIGTGSSAVTSNTTTPATIPEYTFVATATSHAIVILLNETVGWSSSGWFEAVGFYGITMTEIPNTSPYRLQDVAMESSLANHFTIACDTVGAAWWVDRSNVTQFRQVANEAALKASFTDKRTPGSLEYVDIAASYDTRNTINSIKVTNHGRDATSGNTKDVDYTANDTSSISTFGVRSGSLDTEMRSGYIDGTNLFTNPSGEVNANLWSASGGFAAPVRSTAQAHSGTASIAATVSAAAGAVLIGGPSTATWFPGTVGVTYSFAVWLRSSVSRPAYVAVRFINAAGSAQVGPDFVSATVNTSASGWTRYVVNGATMPAGATYIVPIIFTTASVAGEVLYMDDATFNIGATVLPSFDGSTTDSTGNYVYAWTGTPHASTSTRTTFKLLNDRIREVLTGHSTPAVTISRIRWNAQENPTIAAALEVQDRVRVVFRGQTQDSRVVGIKHELSGATWMIELELVKG